MSYDSVLAYETPTAPMADEDVDDPNTCDGWWLDSLDDEIELPEPILEERRAYEPTAPTDESPTQSELWAVGGTLLVGLLLASWVLP